jgi:uncharacterized protein (TIGR02246 family)
MKRIVILLICCWPLGALVQAKGHRGTEGILQLEERWREAQHRNDRTAFGDLLAPDLSFIGTSGSLRSKNDFIRSRETSWIPRADTYAYSEMAVRFYGDSAIVTGREATTGKDVAFQARFTHVWARSKGKWRLVAIQRTNIRR